MNVDGYMNKAIWRAGPWAGLVASGFLACTLAFATQDTTRAELEAAIHRWTAAVNAQDVETLTATMTEDVQLLDAGAATATGRTAALRALREIGGRGRLVATSRELTVVDDIAWRVVGLAQTQKNGDVLSRGQALEVWKRVDGEWKLHRQMAAGLVTPEVSLTRPPTTEPVLDRPRR